MLKTRNLTINGRRTSVKLEPEFWAQFDRIVGISNVNQHHLASAVDRQKKPKSTFTSKLRVFILDHSIGQR